MAFRRLFYTLIVLPGLCSVALAGEPGTPGVATQRKTMSLRELLRPKPVSSEPAPVPSEVHPPLPRSRAQSGSPVEAGLSPSSRPSIPEPLAGEPPTLAASFSALGDNGLSIPPDTHGAVGPNHLMVTLNTEVRIQNRGGIGISVVTLDTFWSGFFNARTFDPKILYDPYHNRWMFTAMADPAAGSSSVLIAVSQTSDPTGVWNIYRVDADAANTRWADYPSMGFNKKWIVVQVNMFTNSGSAFSGSKIYVFDKLDLYSGGTGKHTVFSDSDGFTQTPAITYDDTLSTMYLVEQWVPDNNYDNVNRLRISAITGAAGSETYSPGIAFPTVADFWDDEAPATNFAPQQGTSNKIMTNDARIQNTVYRNGALWCVHTIFLPAGGSPTRSAAQWWSLTPGGTILQRGRIDDPSGVFFYAFPSISVNKNNDALIGYSRFSSTHFPGAGYAFRNGDDPPNTFQTDTVLKTGEAKYFKTFGSSRNRWGDYSHTVPDPLDDVNLWTIQQYAATPSGGSDRWGTWWGQVAPVVKTPQIALAPTAIRFPRVEPGATVAESLLIRNNGNGVLSISNIHTTRSVFTVSQTSFTLAPVESLQIRIAFTPDSIRLYPDTLRITSNDPQTPQLTVPLDAVGALSGDLNGDGRISVLDVILLVRILIEKDPTPPENAISFITADANGDGDLNIGDVVHVINVILKIASRPVAGKVNDPVTLYLLTSETGDETAMKIPIEIDTPQPLSGLHLILSIDADRLAFSAPESAPLSAGMNMEWHIADDRLHLLLYSLSGKTIPSGQGVLLSLPVSWREHSGKPIRLELEAVQAADRSGRGTLTAIQNTMRPLSAPPSVFRLLPGRPNPFNPSTRIGYEVAQASHITLTVYNILGEEVTRLVDAPHIPGRYFAVWNGRNQQDREVASGVYIYRLTSSAGYTETLRVTLLK